MNFNNGSQQKDWKYLELDKTQAKRVIEAGHSVFDDYQLGGFRIQYGLTATYRFKEKGKFDVYAFCRDGTGFKISNFYFEDEFDLLCFEYLMDVNFQFYLSVDRHYPTCHTLIERY